MEERAQKKTAVTLMENRHTTVDNEAESKI